MRITLVYPDQTELEELFSNHRLVPGYRKNPLIPLGVLYLISNLSKKHKAEFIDNNVKHHNNKTLFKEIIKTNPDIVGFGGTMMEWPQAQKVSTMLRKKGIKTIYGGPNATANSEKHVNYFDYVIRRDAEITLNELLDTLSKNKIPKNIKGIWFKNGEKIIKNPDRPYNKQLDLLKYPARQVINMNDYDRTIEFSKSKPFDVVVGSRGCPFTCKFCSSKTFWNQCYLARSVKDVIKEIKYLMKTYKTKGIHFREDNFTVNKKRTSEFCKELKKLGIKWCCQTRVNTINKQLLKEMKDSGCVGVNLGFESINPETLKVLGKGITKQQIIDAIDLLEEVGMNWKGGFMVGVLNENKEDIKRTMNFWKKIKKLPHSHLSGHPFQFMGFPVSELYYKMKKDKLVEYNWNNGELLVPRTKYLKASEVEELITKEEYKNSKIKNKLELRTFYLLKKILPKTVFKEVFKVLYKITHKR